MLKSKNFKKQNLEQGTLILLLSTILTKLIGALFKIPLSSDYCLGDLGFGYFSSAYDFFTPIYMLAISGFPVAVSRLIAQYTADNNRVYSNKIFKISRKLLLILGTVGTAVLAVLMVVYANTDFADYNTAVCLIAIVPAFFFCCVVSAYRGYYEGILNMVPAAFSNVIEALAKLLLGFSFAYVAVRITGNAAIGAAWALFGITLGTFLSAVYLHLRYRFDFKSINSNLVVEEESALSDSSILKLILFGALPIVISSLSGSFVTLIDTTTVRFQLSKLASESFTNLSQMYYGIFDEYKLYRGDELSAELFPTLLYGIRSKAYTVYYLIPTLSTALGIGAVPILAEANKKGDLRLLNESFSSSLKLISLIVFPSSVGMLFLSDRIMDLLYGHSASTVLSGKLLAIYAIAAIFAGFTVPLCSMLQAISLERVALFNVTVGMLIKLVSNILLCRNTQINIIGSAISTLICYAIIFILSIFTLIFKGNINYRTFAVILKPFFASLFCGMSAFLVSKICDNSYFTVLSIAVGAIVYTAFLFLFKVICTAEIEKILKK